MSAKYKWIYQKEYANINQLVLAHIKQKWEKLVWQPSKIK